MWEKVDQANHNRYAFHDKLIFRQGTQMHKTILTSLLLFSLPIISMEMKENPTQSNPPEPKKEEFMARQTTITRPTEDDCDNILCLIFASLIIGLEKMD